MAWVKETVGRGGGRDLAAPLDVIGKALERVYLE